VTMRVSSFVIPARNSLSGPATRHGIWTRQRTSRGRLKRAPTQSSSIDSRQISRIYGRHCASWAVARTTTRPPHSVWPTPSGGSGGHAVISRRATRSCARRWSKSLRRPSRSARPR
jgi:hypothetical protein